MDGDIEKQMQDNSLNYKMSLDRIIRKYSQLQHLDEALEVDLGHTNLRTLEGYMNVSRIELNKMDSTNTSLTDLRDESLRAQDITGDSQFDLMHQDGSADETCISKVSTTLLSVENDGAARNDMTQLTVSSLDESQRSISELEFQPEDQDEELEMTLRSHGCTLVELYPSMISRIERAWHRQHVSEAADSVLRRYRRWRQQSNRSFLNNTFNVTLRHTSRNSRRVTGKTLLMEKSDSLEESQFMRIETTPRSPLRNISVWQAQQMSPGRVNGSTRREQHQPVLVMDFSGLPEISKPKENSLNKTFTVSLLEASQFGEQPSMHSVSPVRSCYPTTKASLDLSLRSKRLSVPTQSPHTGECSAYVSQTTAVTERSDIYGSPVRHSPLKLKMLNSLSSSPLAFSRSHTADFVKSFSREPVRPRARSSSLSSSPQKPTVPLRMIYPHSSHHSLQTQLRSPQSAAATEGRHRLRRHLSFDASLPSTSLSYSPKKLDEDFTRLYHKLICQSKSSIFNGPPCRFCGRSSEASRDLSSSALAALALSPHRSLLRKRHRELSCGSHPQSKRSRDEYCTSSPGSKRHRSEMLRRCLLPSEYEQPHCSLLQHEQRRHAAKIHPPAALSRCTAGNLDEPGA